MSLVLIVPFALVMGLMMFSTPPPEVLCGDQTDDSLLVSSDPESVSVGSGVLTVKDAVIQADQMKVVRQAAAVVHARRGDFGDTPLYRVLVILLITGIQESTLRNLDYGDRDSKGWLQQRPSQGWGTDAQVQDVTYATNKFLDVMLTVPGWQTRGYGDVAQAVQRSGHPEAYDPHLDEAAAIARRLNFTNTGGPSQTITADMSCVSSEGSSDIVERAIEFAKSRVGTPYVWGGTEPGGFDCSGLLLWAFDKAGLTLPRTSREQWGYTGDREAGITTSHVSREELQRGDLVFWSSDGTQSGIYHVGMYLGNDQLLNAANSKSDVLVQSMYYNQGFMGGLRISQAGGGEYTGAWQAPLKNFSYRLSDSYGFRFHPVTGAPGFHNGTDMSTSAGTPIYAAAGGRIERAEYSSAWGNYVIIDHGNVATLYAHMSAFADGISKGSTVSAGKPLGSVGSTGYSTGAHLHFTVCTDISLCVQGSGAGGKGSLEPIRFLQSKGVRVF